MPLWVHNCSLLSLASLACLSLAGNGLVRSWLAQLSPLFCERAWWCLRLGVRAFSRIAIPQSGLLSQVSSLRLPSRQLRPGPYSKQFSPGLPAQPPLASSECGSLHCFSTGNYHWSCNLWVLIIYLFFLLVMLPTEVPRLTTDSAVRVFLGDWKLLSFLRLPSQ